MLEEDLPEEDEGIVAEGVLLPEEVCPVMYARLLSSRAWKAVADAGEGLRSMKGSIAISTSSSSETLMADPSLSRRMLDLVSEVHPFSGSSNSNPASLIRCLLLQRMNSTVKPTRERMMKTLTPNVRLPIRAIFCDELFMRNQYEASSYTSKASKPYCSWIRVPHTPSGRLGYTKHAGKVLKTVSSNERM